MVHEGALCPISVIRLEPLWRNSENISWANTVKKTKNGIGIVDLHKYNKYLMHCMNNLL